MTENERRKFLKAAGATLAVSVLGCTSGTTPDDVAETPPSPDEVITLPAPDTVEAGTLRRAELVVRLKELAQSDLPEELAPEKHMTFACYLPGPPNPNYKPSFSRLECEFCPVCGSTAQAAAIHQYAAPLKRIRDQGVGVKLIPPEHCPTCGPKGQKYHLEIRYPDYPDTIRVELTNGVSDLEMMALFLEGEKRHREIPLKHRVERLEALFGAREKK